MRNLALLIDTNVILDWILMRTPFHLDATRIVDMCMRGKVKGYLAAHTILNIFYITRKDFDVEERRDLSRFLCARFEIIGINQELILDALDAFNFVDIEDGVQEQAAVHEQLDYIVTRDVRGFVGSKVKVLLPEDFLREYSHYI